MNLIDAAYGAGSSVNVNGNLVIGPNFNGTIPAAPVGKTNVIWQVDINGNISAYATASSNAAGSDTQVQYNNAGAFGADANLEWLYSTGELFINNTLAMGGSGPALAIGTPLANPLSSGWIDVDRRISLRFCHD